MLRIALAQINPTVGDLAGNRQKVIGYIRSAQKQDADIVVFPEMAVCGYPPEDLLYKDHFVRDNLKALRSLVKETEGIVVIIGFADIDKDKRLYNAAAVMFDGRLKGVYRKEELPNYGVFDEKRYFHPGEDNKIFSMAGINFGVSICEDIWVEKSVCQRQSREGARLLINISCSPYEVGKLEGRERLLKRRAARAKGYVCYVNLVGGQDELVFDGGSLVVDPRGRVVARAKEFEEDLMVVDLELDPPARGRGKPSRIIPVGRTSLKKEKTPLGCRGVKHFSRVEGIYRALVLGTSDYAGKNGFKKAVLGLSGGVDSALVAAIAVDALGKDNVVGVTMPSQFTSRGTYADAKQLAKNLDIKIMEIPIKNVFESYLSELKQELQGTDFGLAEENLQARIRGNILMALSNKFGWLVLTTGNKSEVSVGYCTLYGDMSGGFAVIKDVLKTTVYELVRFRNARDKELIPRSIVERAPSAELRENQKDQDSLPPYDVLDAMLKEYVEGHRSLGQMARGNDKGLVKGVIELVDRNEYKRRQAPPGIKITPRAFGKDWRLPVTNKYRES
jgi:NAD+ synthase (glutamine-hydrolysing)